VRTTDRPVRLSWAKLLKRVFEIDMEHCPNCGGQLKIIAAILEQPVIEKILTHLGLQARAPLGRLLVAISKRQASVLTSVLDRLIAQSVPGLSKQPREVAKRCGRHNA